MKRRVLMVLLGLGAVFGFSSGVAHMRHGGWGCRDRGGHHGYAAVDGRSPCGYGREGIAAQPPASAPTAQQAAPPVAPAQVQVQAPAAVSAPPVQLFFIQPQAGGTAPQPLYLAPAPQAAPAPTSSP